MAKDRARDMRRSVGSHQEMMNALGNAAIATTPGEEPKGGFLHHWIAPTASDTVGSPENKVETAYRKGHITEQERSDGLVEAADMQGKKFY